MFCGVHNTNGSLVLVGLIESFSFDSRDSTLSYASTIDVTNSVNRGMEYGIEERSKKRQI